MQTRFSTVYYLLSVLCVLMLSTHCTRFKACSYKDYYCYPMGTSPQDAVHNFVDDLINTTAHVMTPQCMGILTLFAPLYIGGRMVDDEVHAGFYDSAYHKNIDEPCDWLKDCSGFHFGSLFFPSYVIGALAQFSDDENTRITGGMVYSGIVGALLTKEVFKQIQMGVRPLNQHYDPCNRVYNGFPSGHMVAASYLAVLFGMRLGPKWGIPLTFMALLIGGMTIACNTHYTSQVVAGAAVGAVFAVASSQVADIKLCRLRKCLHMRAGVSPSRRPCVALTCEF